MTDPQEEFLPLWAAEPEIDGWPLWSCLPPPAVPSRAFHQGADMSYDSGMTLVQLNAITAERDALRAELGTVKTELRTLKAYYWPAPTAHPSEVERLRAAQTDAVMMLIGPLLDAWEGCASSVRSEHSELDLQLRRINRAMEDAGEDDAPTAQPVQAAPVSAEDARKPLTGEAILDGFCQTKDIHQFVTAFKEGVRWAEKQHGIGAALAAKGAQP